MIFSCRSGGPVGPRPEDVVEADNRVTRGDEADGYSSRRNKIAWPEAKRHHPLRRGRSL